MLDRLKKDRQAGLPAQERVRLSLYVAGLLLLGGVIAVGYSSKSKPQSDENEKRPLASGEGKSKKAGSGLEPGPLLDPARLEQLISNSGDEPNRYAAQGIEHVLDIKRRGRLGPVSERLTPAELASRSAAMARGRVFEVPGRVIEVSREVYQPEGESGAEGRLWSVVLAGEDGTQFVALKYALASEYEEGAPREAKPPRVAAERIAPDQYVLVRGVFLQQRTGTLGTTVLAKPSPVLMVPKFHIELPPAERTAPIATIEEALWDDVQDRFMRETRRWDEDAVFEILQWARDRGYEACRDDILDGTLPWKAWGLDRFAAWKKEVKVKAHDPRPLTEASRGKLFRISGIVGEVLDFGWERVPANPWSVDSFQALTLLTDHYRNVSLRLFLPFPMETFKGVTGKRAEHLRVYGVFVKNFTYDTKFPRDDGTDRRLPITVPLFVVLHVEPFPDDLAGQKMRELMFWVAGGMLLFGLLFYIVLIRGGGKQDKRMEEHRMALRRSARAKGQGPMAPSKLEIPGADDGGDSSEEA